MHVSCGMFRSWSLMISLSNAFEVGSVCCVMLRSQIIMTCYALLAKVITSATSDEDLWNKFMANSVTPAGKAVPTPPSAAGTSYAGAAVHAFTLAPGMELSLRIRHVINCLAPIDEYQFPCPLLP